MSCAVKSLPGQPSLKDRIEFLREAALMEGIRFKLECSISSLVFGSVILNDAFPAKECPCGEADGNGDEVTGSQKTNNRVSVFNSQPVLVVMEFMENGDLQSFLKKHRQV